MKRKIFLAGIGIISLSSIPFSSRVSAYSQEEIEAYNRAYQHGITTQSTIDKANMKGKITRAELAKMMVGYSVNIMNKETTTESKCKFDDIGNINSNLKIAILQACDLGIMGQGVNNFRPNETVTRAEFGTVLSRVLRGNKNEGGSKYYEKHLEALKSEGIMSKINTPMDKEVRGFVMLMLMRSENKNLTKNPISGSEKIENNSNEKGSTASNINCYSKGGSIEKNPKKDVNGNIINCYNENKQREGKRILYDENGNIGEEANYKEGKQEGKRILYYENGNIREEGNYKEGEQEGKRIGYYINGNTGYETNLVNGKKEGKGIGYYLNGELEFEGNFVDGERGGEWIEYYDNGQVKWKGNYKNGKLEGKLIYYDRDGNITKEENYKDGELIN